MYFVSEVPNKLGHNCCRCAGVFNVEVGNALDILKFLQLLDPEPDIPLSAIVVLQHNRCKLCGRLSIVCHCG